MLFSDLVAVSLRASATRSRKAKVGILAECLRAFGPDEIEPGTGFLLGEPRQGKIGFGYARLHALRGAVAAAPGPTLVLLEVDAALERIRGARGQGSRATQDAEIGGLFARASEAEQDFLARLLLGELRQGAEEGLLLEAVAQASGSELGRVRRAAMLSGDLREIARCALLEGESALAAYRLEPFRPISPMLAATVEDVGEPFATWGRVAVEDKLDGARVQLHKDGGEIRVYSRQQNEVGARVPEIVELARSFGPARLVLDGELVALAADGRPRSFQDTMRRFGRSLEVERLRRELPVHAVFFDALLLEGDELIDRPNRERAEALAAAVPTAFRIRRRLTSERAEAEAFFAEALAAGHEGVMLKSLEAPYEAGRRGATWLKWKPAHTLDLVVLAVEHGSGRRKGWLSNLHLGARDPANGGFVMLGKTFKGMTDEMLAWQTAELGKLAVETDGYVVRVRPELVVEIAFDGVQRSPQYPGGVALRFARVKRYRPDKSAAEADTIEAVQKLNRG